MNGHLADIDWGLHFSCLAGYKLNYTYNQDWNIPSYYWNGQYYYYSGDSYSSQEWVGADAPFLLVKERGKVLQFSDPMEIYDVPWCYEGYGNTMGPLTGEISFSGPTTHSDAGHHPYIMFNRYYANRVGNQWPGSYRRAYPILNSNTGLLDAYMIHSRRPDYGNGSSGSAVGIHHFVGNSFACSVSPDYDTELRPPGYYYPSDTFTYKENTRPNGRFAWHAGGGTLNRSMLRIAPKSYKSLDYDDPSGKDRSVYLIDGKVYDYDQPVPLLFGDNKVSRELLVAQSIYGMSKPAVVDSAIDLYGGGTLTGKKKGYLDLEGYDGYGYFSDFGNIKKSAVSEPLETVCGYPDTHTNDAPINSKVTVQFDTPVDSLTVNSASFSLVESVSGTAVSGNFSFDFNDTVVIFSPRGDPGVGPRQVLDFMSQ